MRVEFDQAGGDGGALRQAQGANGPDAQREEEEGVPEDFRLPAALRDRKARLTERIPALFPAAVALHRMRRRAVWATSGIEWASRRQTEDLPVRVKQHKSLLLRTLGQSEMWMQHNKVTNLKLAVAQMDGLIIEPGQEFSFCRIVGKSSKRKGYVDGMLLDNGEAKPGVGGGICQLANLLHWMVLHSPLVVTERSEHSFDPFPDNGRVLPWGVGCAVYYNYVDFRFRNETPATYQLRLSVGDRYLAGELRSDRPQTHSYKVFAVDEQFVPYRGQWYRMNEIWRNVIDRRTGDHVRKELIKKNCAMVKYLPPGVADATRRAAGLGEAEVVQ